jgi:CheY-like chemotaxis protein
MIDKKRLLSITALNIADQIDQMDDGQLQAYVEKLDFFIDSFPGQEKRLITAIETKDYDSFFDCMATIYVSLRKIRADVLAEECFKQIDALKDLGHNEIEAWMTCFSGKLNTLSVDIQIAEYKKEKECETQRQDKSTEQKEEQKTILAVDDAAFFLNMLKQYVSGTGHKLICVNSGNAALQYLMTHDPDLFILDIEMPEMNGYKLAQEIRNKGKKAPIIFLTGNAKREYVVKAMKIGASDFIIKPITQVQVLDRINKFI